MFSVQWFYQREPHTIRRIHLSGLAMPLFHWNNWPKSEAHTNSFEEKRTNKTALLPQATSNRNIKTRRSNTYNCTEMTRSWNMICGSVDDTWHSSKFWFRTGTVPHETTKMALAPGTSHFTIPIAPSIHVKQHGIICLTKLLTTCTGSDSK